MRLRIVFGGVAALAVLTMAASAQVRAPVEVRPQGPALRDAPNLSNPEVPVFLSRTGRWENIDIPGWASGPSGASGPRVDNDRDGFASYASGGDDCDDNDMNNWPGTNREVADFNGHDEDCNPHTIVATYDVVGAMRASEWRVADRDGDGWISHRVYNIARAFDRRPLGIVRGADCDDGDAGVHPAAPETPGDGKDNNCDGAIDVQPVVESDYCAPPQRTRASNARACATPRR